MTARLSVTALLAAVLASGALAGCGGSGSPKLIPADSAEALDGSIQEVADATASGDCGAAESALVTAEDQLASLPRSVDTQLKERIGEGLRQLEATVPAQCREAKPKTTTTEPTTTEPTTTTTEPTTETTTTTTRTTTTTTPTTPTTTPDTGGITPGGSGGAGQ
ncbi:MAG: hypothetical protein ACKOB9_03995 [Solirubrobacterales bacterium]